jgi:8-oxo-dGTP pyrophosphatase MutT (NUDIX family)
MPEAVVIVIRSGARFVAIRRAGGVARAGYWSPPTGRLEVGESQAEAVQREAMEELGLAVQPLQRDWECWSDDGVWRLHWWLARPLGFALRPAPAEVSEALWVSASEFLALAPSFTQHREYFAQRFRAEEAPDGVGDALRSPVDRSPSG